MTLLKVACQFSLSVRRILFSLSSIYPRQHLFAQVALALCAALPPPALRSLRTGSGASVRRQGALPHYGCVRIRGTRQTVRT